MSEVTRKIAIFSCLLFTSFCFWKAGTGLIGDADTEILPSAQAAMSPSLSPPRVVTTPIQEMQPGMRVVGRNPLRIETEATIDPTPEGWRLVSVRMRKEDGTYFEAELLRPLSWLRQHQAQPGAVIMLNMPELHVVGAAEVLAVSACPPIDPGNGPVVISTFKNTADNILNIYVEGETEPIGVTAGHPIWSEDRQTFIHSDQLQPGERLRSVLGKTVRITSIEIRAGPEPVYNLEVVGEHVYSVTDSGLLVHNTGPCDPDLYQLSGGSKNPRGGLPEGITFEGTVHRAVNSDYADSAFGFHSPSNLAGDHRYSGIGRGGIYSGTSKEAVLGELAHYGSNPNKVAWATKEIRVTNVLDLTNSTNRKQLGISLEDITGDSYLYTQAIGDRFRSRGYNGILFPSARAPGTTNFVEFINHAN